MIGPTPAISALQVRGLLGVALIALASAGA
jgi:hypothetical protein